MDIISLTISIKIYGYYIAVTQIVKYAVDCTIVTSSIARTVQGTSSSDGAREVRTVSAVAACDVRIASI